MLQGFHKEKEECALEFSKNIFSWKGPEPALMQREMLIIRHLGSGSQAPRIARTEMQRPKSKCCLLTNWTRRGGADGRAAEDEFE